MATIKRFEEIEAWKVAKELCFKIGTIVDEGSFKNSYRLIAQIEGSSGSIMDNIAEGFERGTQDKGRQVLSTLLVGPAIPCHPQWLHRPVRSSSRILQSYLYSG